MSEGVSCHSAFPGYLVAAFDIFCCISAHARLVALSLVRSTVGLFDCLCDCLFDCACLLELRGSVGFGAAFGGDVACGCFRWRPVAYSVRSPALFGDVDRSCFFARDASARASISRRWAERESGFLRAFSWANSNGCWVAIWLRSPAA